MRFAGPSSLRTAMAAAVLSYDMGSIVPAQEPPRYFLQWGGLGANPGQFNRLQDMDLAGDGTLFVLEGPPNKRVQRFAADGTLLGAWQSSWFDPQALAVGPDGSVFVIDYSYLSSLVDGRIVQRFSPDGAPMGAWGSFGDGPGQFRARRGDGDIGPRNVGVSSDGDVYVTDPNSDRVLRFDSGGRFLAAWGGTGAGPGQFNFPGDVIVSAAGEVYVTDRRNDRIQVFGRHGSFLRSFGHSGAAPGQLQSPYGMAVDADGNLYIADTLNYRIQKLSSAGSFILEWGHQGSAAGEFDGVFKVAADAAQHFFVLDCWNDRIQRFDAGPTTIAPSSWSVVKQLFR